MGAMSRFLLCAVVPACLAAHCFAVETKPSLDTVLAKWEAATAKIKTLDARVYRWKYDSVFGSPNKEPLPEEGRFYYEAPQVGCLQIKSDKRAAWKGLSEMIVWHEKDTLMFDGERRNCTKFVLPDSTTRDWQPMDGFWPGFAAFLRALQNPMSALPLTIDIHSAEIRERYVLTFQDQGDRYLIRAIPKKASAGASYCKIEVLVDSKTYLTAAIESISPNGKDRMVWMLADVKINERPTDRDQLLSPDLHGLVVREVK